MIVFGAYYTVETVRQNATINQYKDKLKSFTVKKPEFSGVSRKDLCDKLIEETKSNIVILFGPTHYGKSYLLQEIAQINENTLLIKLQKSITETMNTVGLPFEFNQSQTKEAVDILQFIIEQNSYSFVIIDGIENLNDHDEKRLLVFFNNFRNKNKLKLLISTSNIKICDSATSYLKNSVFEIPPLTKQEAHLALKDLPGYNFENVENVWNCCQGGLDFILDMMKQGKNWEEYLDDKKKLIIANIERLVQVPEWRLKVINCVSCANGTTPLGNLYSRSELANELVAAGIMQNQLNGSTQFRNKFIVKTISDYLKSN